MKENYTSNISEIPEKIDACVFHDDLGNVILVMTPYVARVIQELSGEVSGGTDGPIRKAADTIWNEMGKVVPLNSEDYIFRGEVEIRHEKGTS